jgi:hypothetical protein
MLTVPRPQLVLHGLITGDTMRALIEGLPGSSGSRVVRVGDVVGGLRVATIAGGSVRIIGMDTTWILRLRRAEP